MTPTQHLTALVIDDEPHIVRAVRNALAPDFARVLEAANAKDGVDQAAAQRPDVLILDLGLPDRPGLWVCAEVRKWSTAPIIVLSAHHSEAEKVRLLDAGADDYVTKPFSLREFQARVRAQLRRAQLAEAPGDGVVRLDDLEINPGARTVRRADVDIHLTPTEWELLRVFLRHRGKTLTHRQLFREVWATSSGDPQQYLRVYAANLRRKLGADFSLQEMAVPEAWVGRSLRELQLPRRHSISVVAVHDMLADSIQPVPDPDAPLKDSDTLIVAGTEASLSESAKLR